MVKGERLIGARQRMFTLINSSTSSPLNYDVQLGPRFTWSRALSPGRAAAVSNCHFNSYHPGFFFSSLFFFLVEGFFF